MAAPLYTSAIWRDIYYTISEDDLESDSVLYRIELDGEEIFAGKAVKYPDADEIKININKVCRNYLESDIYGLVSLLPASSATVYQPYEQRTFNLFVDDDNVADYRFHMDYSYTNDKPSYGSNVNLSNPINGHYVPGMLKVKTTRTSSISSSDVHTDGIANADSGFGYTVLVKCTPYVLIYLNSYGGWDSFVIEGSTVKKDSYTTFTTDKVFNNTTPEFETSKYVNEIKTTYELNTGILSDDEAENLAKNLVGSVKVYLQNIDEGWIKPVIINDTNVIYQKYSLNNRKFCQYKINVTESQSKIRR